MGFLDFLKGKSALDYDDLGPDFAKPNTAGWFGRQGDIAIRGVRNQLEQYEGWVFAAVSLVADDVSQIEFVLSRIRPDGDDVRILKHDILDLLNTPNDSTSRYDFYKSISIDLDLVGRAFVYIVRDQVSSSALGKPGQLLKLDPGRMRIEHNGLDQPTLYTYTQSNGRILYIIPDNMVDLKEINPADIRQGKSTVAAAAAPIIIDKSSNKLTNKSLSGGLMPGGALKVPGELDRLGRDAIDNEFREKYAGVDNFGRPIILEQGAEYQPLSLKPADTQMIDSKHYHRDFTLGMFRVPKLLVGITETTNRATAETANLVFSERKIAPRMRLITSGLAMKLVRDPLLRLDHVDPIPQDKQFTLESADKATKLPWRTINETRLAEGLESISGGDVIYRPLTQRPLDEAVNVPQP